MKKMRIEKSLLFQDPVEKVLTLKVTEGFTYKQEEDGIRAVGPLFIRGIYENDTQHNFQEILEMDVLAPNEKLSGDKFYLEVGEYQGVPGEDGIDVLVMINIHGLVEETSTKEATTKETTKPKQNIINSQPIVEMEKPLEVQPEQTKEAIVEPVNETSDAAAMEDLFEDANNVYTSYRIIVAKPNDTYETIAQRYSVQEDALRSTNANKNVQSKTLIILPYENKEV